MGNDPEDIAAARQFRQAGMGSLEQLTQALQLQGQALERGQQLSLIEALVLSGVITPEQRAAVLQHTRTQKGKVQELGPYRLRRKLGEGGMGAVYLADDSRSGRPVALKVLSRAHAGGPDFLHRFKREAEAATRLQHPNIVRALEAGEDLGYHYYAMEYCEGESLEKLLRMQGHLAWKTALDIVIQVARGLESAHRSGFIHRDIKPANIFLSTDRTAKILDLGLAKRIDELHPPPSGHTATGAVLGTPHYISPEQAKGSKSIDGRSDIYSLGATLYHLITGALPFGGTTLYELLEKHVNAQLPNPQDVVEGIPDALVIILRRMMAKSPEARYPSCRELIADLERLRDGKTPAQTVIAGDSSTVSLVKRTQPPRKRPGTSRPPLAEKSIAGKRGWIVVGASASGLLVLILAVIAFRAGRSPGALPESPMNKPVGGAKASTKESPRERAAALLRKAQAAFAQRQYSDSLEASKEGLDLLRDTPSADPLRQDLQARMIEAEFARSDDHFKSSRFRKALSGYASIRALDPTNTRASDRIREARMGIEGEIENAKIGSLMGHKGGIYSISFSPDGKRLATAGTDKTVRIWDVKTQAEIRRLEDHREIVWAVEYSPDGKTIASAGGGVITPTGRVEAPETRDYGIRFWDSTTGKLIRTLTGHTSRIMTIAHTPDGRILAAGGLDGVIRFWELSSGTQRRTLSGHTDMTEDLCFSSDGKRLVSSAAGKDFTARIWDTSTGRLLSVLSGHKQGVGAVDISPRGDRIATGSWDKTVKFWDAETGDNLHTLEGYSDGVEQLKYSPTGEVLAWASRDATLRICLLPDMKEVITLIGHRVSVVSLAFSPDGKRLASGGVDSKVNLWNLEPLLD
jgi:WD40 repeat protein/serine/threonine protein kinase